MPRNVNPSTLTPGGGLAPPGTVEDNSLRYPERDVDPLRAHLQDPVRAHMASAIGIVDAGDYFTSTNVEGALQELGADSGAGSANRQNGWIAAGTSVFATAAVVGGATVTLAGTWQAITNNGLVDVSGATITIAGAAGTYWVYLDSLTDTLVQLAAPAVPDITNDEDIPVGLFLFNGAAITGQRDARFFVRNDNRKITYTVRGDGSEEDANSEGAFATIEGAFSWLQAYTTGAGGVSQKSRLTLRGAFTVTNILTIPVDNLEIVGEDGATITFTSGVATDLFDVDAHTNVTFSNLNMVCNTAGFTAAITDLTGPTTGLTVDNCRFSGTGGNLWAFPVGLTLGVTNVTVKNCTSLSVAAGVYIDNPAAFDSSGVTITGNRVEGALFGGYGVFGNVTRITITDNHVDGYLGVGTEPTAIGISVNSNNPSGENPSNAVIAKNFVYRCAFGISCEGRYDARADNDFTVISPVAVANNDTLIVTDAAGVTHTLTAKAAGPIGTDQFLIDAGSAANTATNIIAAINNTANTFYEEVVHAVSTGAGAVRFYAVPQGEVGNTFTLAAGVGAGFNIPSASFANGTDGSIQGVIISENTVTNCAISTAGGGGFSYLNVGAVGIGMNFTRDCRIVDNDIREIGILIDNTGAPIIPAFNGPIENSAGITVWNSTRFAVERNTVLNTTGTATDEQRGIYVVTGDQGVEASFTNTVTDSSVCDNKIDWSLEGNFAATAGATYGSFGINVLTSIVVAPGADSAQAFYAVDGLKVDRNSVTNCDGDGIRISALERSGYQSLSVDQNSVYTVGGNGINLDVSPLSNTAGFSGFVQTSVSGNNVLGADIGILVDCTRDTTGNLFTQITLASNRLARLATGGIDFSFATVDAANMPNVSQIDITGNETVLSGSGVTFTAAPADNLTINKAFENIRINGNSILDAGSDTGHAIEFNLTNWEPSYIEVSGNTVSGSNGTPSPGGGLRMNVASTNATPTNYGMAFIEAADNTFFLSGTLPVGTATVVVTAPFIGGETLDFYFPPTGTAVSLTAVAGAPATDEFQITGAINTDAVAIRNALNNASNSFADFVTASITTAGTVNLVADTAMPGSMCGMTGPIQTGAAVTTITPFTGTGVGVNERRATFVFTVNNNAGFNAGTSQLVVDLPGANLPTPLTFVAGAPGANQIQIGANAAATAANIVTSVAANLSGVCSASIYAGDPSGRSVLLTAGIFIPGRLGNYTRFEFTPGAGSQNAINYGNEDQFFSYGEDDMINGVSLEADGLVVQANVQRNTITYSGANATANRRPAFIRSKQAVIPFSADILSVGALTVAAAGVPPAGVGGGQTFTIDDGINPAVIFEYVIPQNSPYNPTHVPIGLDPGTPLAQLRDKTLAVIQQVASTGRLFVVARNSPSVATDIQLLSVPDATVSGAINLLPAGGLPLVATNWVGGAAGATANAFGESYGLNIEDNDFFGGIGSRVQVYNGFVARGLSFSRNRVGRAEAAVAPCDPGVTYPGYYHGFSVHFRASFASAAVVSLRGSDQSIGITASDNDFVNLGHGATHIHKDETKNNLFPFVIDTTFANNKVYNCGLSGVVPTMMALEMWGANDLGVAASLSITGNSIEESVVFSDIGRSLDQGSSPIYTDGPSAALILVRPYVSCTDVTVSRNTLLGGTSTSQATAIGGLAAAVAVFPGAANPSRDIRINDNQVHGVNLVSGGTTFPVFASHLFVGSPLNFAEGQAGTVTGIEVCRNQIVETYSTGEYWGSSTAVATTGALAFPYVGGIIVNGVNSLNAMMVDDNTVDVVQQSIVASGAPPVYFNAHILVMSGYAPALPGTSGLIVGGSISGNTINAVNDNTLASFTLFTSAVEVQASAYNLKMDNNKIVITGDSTHGFFTGSGGFLWSTGFRSSSISGNSITALGVPGGPGGTESLFLGLTHPGNANFLIGGLDDTSIANNTFTSSTSAPWDRGIYGDGTDFTRVTVANNSVTALAAIKTNAAARCVFTGNALVGETTVPGICFYFAGNVDDTTATGNTISAFSHAFQFDGTLERSSLVGNTARNLTSHGFLFGSIVETTEFVANGIYQLGAGTFITGMEFQSDADSIRIADNTFQTFTNGIVFSAASTFSSLTITGNQIAATDTGAIGIYFSDVASVLSNSAVTGNRIQGDDTGFYIEGQVSTTAISGNMVQADDGFWFGDDFERSTLSGNVARVTSSGFAFNVGASLISPSITGNVVYGDGIAAAATGGAASGPSGTCISNVGNNLGAGQTWDGWANSVPLVAVYRVGATPLNN